VEKCLILEVSSILISFIKKKPCCSFIILQFLEENFDERSEIKGITEEPTWLTCSKEKRDRVQQEIKDEWIVTGKVNN
jgi:hypothetical protein